MELKIVSKLILIVLILFICPIKISSMEDVEGIIMLTRYTFDEELQKNSKLFVLFHKIEKNEDLEPFIQILKEFKQAHKIMTERNWPIGFAIADTANNPQLAERNDIKEFPSLRLFIDGYPVYYTLTNKLEDILYFLEIKIQPVSQEFYIPEDLEQFIANKEALVFFGDPKKENPKYQQYLSVARQFDDVLFAHCGTYQCIEYYKIDWDNLIFFNKQNNLSFDLKDPYTDQMIKHLIESHYTKVLTYFDEWVADYIFTRNNVGLFLFRDRNNPEHKKYEIMIKRVSKFFKGIIHFIIVDIKEKYEIELARVTKIKEKDLPSIYIHDARLEQIFTYKMEDSINEHNIFNFAVNFGLEKLQPHYPSEDIIPLENQTYPVMTLVGKSYQDLILDDKQNDILVYIYSEDCKHCHKAQMLFEKFATKVLENNKNIKFMKMNLDLNDLPQIEILGLPNYKLFPVNNRSNHIDYPLDQDRSLKRLAEFLINNLQSFNMTGFDNQLDEEFEIEYENTLMKNEEYLNVKDEI